MATTRTLWNAAAPPRPGRRRGSAPMLLALLLAPVLSGCETMERMDYLDRFFEPAPRPLAAAATEPAPVPADLQPAPDWTAPPTSVVSMNPIENPADRWTAADRPPQGGGAARPVAGPRPETGAPQGNDEEARTRLLVRQNPWLTRFWMELTPAQRARVERRLSRGGDVRLASSPAEPAVVWDPMGLSDRANLVFGGGAAPPRPAAPLEDRAAPSMAGGS